MEEESSAVNQLGSLALGNLLHEIGVDSDAGMERFGLGPKPSAASFGRDQIYNEQYEDDDDEELRHMAAEKDDAAEREQQKRQREEQERYFAKGLASIAPSQSAVRGESTYDDYDEDEDEDERPLPARERSETPPADIKMEDEEDRLFSSPGRRPSPPSQSQSEAGPSTPREAVAAPAALRLPTPPPRRDVKEYWPDFEPDKVLDFTDFFSAPRRKRRKVAPGRSVRIHATNRDGQENEIEAKAADKGQRRRYLYDVAPLEFESERLLAKQRLGRSAAETVEMSESALKLPELDDWESKIMVDPDVPSQALQVDISRPVNRALNSADWMDGIIWSAESARDPRKVELSKRLILDLNDEDMMIEVVEPESEGLQNTLLGSAAPSMLQRPMHQSAAIDPLNMSNDGYYELSREQRQRIQRQTLGALVVQHTRIARKLQLPFYRTRLTKSEARHFHRPSMQFPINIPLSFSRVERLGGSKKDKKRGKDVDEVIRSTRDLTLKEQGSFVLYEYAEEHPPIPSKIGMGSILVNYYRKKNTRDEHIPKLDLGETYILEPNDESPFLKFGSVDPGQVQSTLYNNLVRAPLFRHEPQATDFLLVRVTSKNHVRYYLRDIKNIFAVGQNYPLAVIPGPHARLVTNAIRNRLIMVARRLVEQSKGQRIKIHRIMKYFPDQTELQMRQRLKEFMEYARKAGDPNQGYWRLRPNVPLPTDAELEKLLPPEHICLSESMQAGQRYLLDAGYDKAADGAEEEEDKEQDIEQLLAPWITSKNFIMATQGKAMLRLHGDGDPTGRGEAFSFVRISMKDVFHKAGEDHETRMAQQAEEEKRSGHKYNVARQQQIYREEIDRIWNAQRAALSSSTPPQLTELEANPPPTPEPEEEPLNLDDEDIKPTLDAEGKIDSSRCMRITRTINGRTQTEIVRDPKVVRAYILARRRMADEATHTEDLAPTGDAELDAARRRRIEEEIAQAKKHQERRLARHAAKAAAEGRALPAAYKKLLAQQHVTSRRCGRCGQVGHMSSNRSCPLWGQDAPAAPGSISSASATKGGASGLNSASSSVPGTPCAAVPPSPIYTPGGMPGTPAGSFFPPAPGLHSRNSSFSGLTGGAESPSPAGGAKGLAAKIKLKLKPSKK